LVSSSKYKCDFAYCKKAFSRSFNAIFVRIGRLASEEILLHLIKAKCLPVLLYGVEVYPVNISDVRSLEFTVKRIMIKLFRTYDSLIFNSRPMSFLRARASIAIARNSVCPSGCPSVCHNPVPFGDQMR